MQPANFTDPPLDHDTDGFDLPDVCEDCGAALTGLWTLEIPDRWEWALGWRPAMYQDCPQCRHTVIVFESGAWP